VPQGQFAPKPLLGGGKDDQRATNVRAEAAQMRMQAQGMHTNAADSRSSGNSGPADGGNRGTE
jgi:hypothetical protein